MEMKVNLGKDSYPIYIQKGILEHVIDYIQPIYQGKKIMIISDDQVYGYYGEKLFEQLESCYEVDISLFLMVNNLNVLIFYQVFIVNYFHFN